MMLELGLRGYVVVSGVAVALVVAHAVQSREQFYPAALYLSTSKIALAAGGNLALALALCFWRLTKWFFLGRLREAEVERLSERARDAVMEICLAMTIFREEFNVPFVSLFGLLLFVKSFHWLSQDRLEHLETSPAVRAVQHARCLALMGALLLVDVYFLKYCVQQTVEQGPSVLLLFAFEYIVQASSVISSFVKYLIFVADSALEGAWEGKGVCVFYLELVTDLFHLFTYSIFFVIIFMFYGLPLHLVRELYWTFSNFRNRLLDFIRYRRITTNMDDRFQDATPEQLAEDNVCIICREEMTEGKRLACGHIFHARCLRSWLERQQSCPTCRAQVMPAEPPAIQRVGAGGAPARGVFEAAAAAAVAPGAGIGDEVARGVAAARERGPEQPLRAPDAAAREREGGAGEADDGAAVRAVRGGETPPVQARPQSDAQPETPAPLPEGWEEAMDQGQRRPYYFNRGTGERTWDRPVAGAVGPGALPVRTRAEAQSPRQQAPSHAPSQGATGSVPLPNPPAAPQAATPSANGAATGGAPTSPAFQDPRMWDQGAAMLQHPWAGQPGPYTPPPGYPPMPAYYPHAYYAGVMHFQEQGESAVRAGMQMPDGMVMAPMPIPNMAFMPMAYPMMGPEAGRASSSQSPPGAMPSGMQAVPVTQGTVLMPPATILTHTPVAERPETQSASVPGSPANHHMEMLKATTQRLLESARSSPGGPIDSSALDELQRQLDTLRSAASPAPENETGPVAAGEAPAVGDAARPEPSGEVKPLEARDGSPEEEGGEEVPEAALPLGRLESGEETPEGLRRRRLDRFNAPVAPE